MYRGIKQILVDCLIVGDRNVLCGVYMSNLQQFNQAVISDAHQYFFHFIKKHKSQIRQKSYKFSLHREEIENTIFIFIRHNWHKYDPTRGSFEAFIFSSIERMWRYSNDALDRTQNVSDVFFDARCEIVAQDLISDSYIDPEGIEPVPGGPNLLSIAIALAGKNSREIAAEMKISKRRANQILKKIRDDAKNQFGLNFDGDLS